MYKKINQLNEAKEVVGFALLIFRLEDNAFIPFDPANTDYQAFLRWCEEGNTPEPADEGA